MDSWERSRVLGIVGRNLLCVSVLVHQNAWQGSLVQSSFDASLCKSSDLYGLVGIIDPTSKNSQNRFHVADEQG